jgi:hypothetical protein
LCVCRFHVAAKHHLQSSLSLLSWSTLNLSFIIEGKLAATLIIPSSWGSQRAGHSPRTRTNCSHVNYTPPSFLAPSPSSRQSQLSHRAQINGHHCKQKDPTDRLPASELTF